jgi:ribose/xylose/arabinose/galactoside ABC-type transport system permease subunit
VSVAFALVYGCYLVGMLWVAGRLSSFRWSAAVRRLLALVAAVILTTFALMSAPPAIWGLVIGALLSGLTGIYSLCQITAHVGPDHLLSRTILRLPFIRRLLVP